MMYSRLIMNHKIEKMKSQGKTKTLLTNWAINNTIDYSTYDYDAQKPK